jgi:transposase
VTFASVQSPCSAGALACQDVEASAQNAKQRITRFAALPATLGLFCRWTGEGQAAEQPRVLNGIFWLLRAGAQRRDSPER